MADIYKNFKLLLKAKIKSGKVADESMFDSVFGAEIMPDEVYDENFDEYLELFIQGELYLATYYLTKCHDSNVDVQQKYLKQIFLRNIDENNLTYAVYAMTLKVQAFTKFIELFKFNEKELNLLSKKFNSSNLKNVLLQDIEDSELNAYLSDDNKDFLATYLKEEIELMLNNSNDYYNFCEISEDEEDAMKREFDYMLSMLKSARKEKKSMEKLWDEI